MINLRKVANVEDPGSVSNRMRSRRMEKFAGLIASLPKPIRILDVGGTALFWQQRGWTERPGVHITTVNLEAEAKKWPSIDSVKGDATRMPEFGDKSFDVVFSNSVIEHLFTFENQAKMAAEVQRIGRAFWVQTPNYWFPIEPHFHVPGWQWMPVSMRVAMLRRRRCGWRGPCPNTDEARALVTEVRLLTASEMRRVFPTAKLWRERVMGLTKSFVAIGGFSSI